MYYLYIKTHNKTGLKYLGYTKSDPLIYKGSGKYWKRHIQKHGYDVSTEIVKICEDKNEIRKLGEQISQKYDIVNSSLWANLKNEQGDGGFDYINENKPNEEIRRIKLSISHKGLKKNYKPGLIAAIKKTKGHTWEEILGENKALERRNINSNFMTNLNKQKITCPKCKKTGQRSAMKRWHFINCKAKDLCI